jgi:formylglycine-generating enzyme required for sulfatase activity
MYSGSNDLDDVAWYNRNSGYKTHDVATKRANELGLFDMTGNVAEWCQDWFGDNYYSSSPSSNPTGPATGSYRVDRGGSWDGHARNCRVANRLRDYAGIRSDDLGFRLAL